MGEEGKVVVGGDGHLVRALPVKGKSRSLDQSRSIGQRERESDGFVNLPFRVIRDKDFEARLPVRRCRRRDEYIHAVIRPIGVIGVRVNNVSAVIRSVAAQNARSRDFEGNQHASGRNGEKPGGVKLDSVSGTLVSCRSGRGETDGLRVRGNINGVPGLAQFNAVAAGGERITVTAQREFNGLVAFLFPFPVAKDGEKNLPGETVSECFRHKGNALLRVGKHYIVGPGRGAHASIADLNDNARFRRNVQADGDSMCA